MVQKPSPTFILGVVAVAPLLVIIGLFGIRSYQIMQDEAQVPCDRLPPLEEVMQIHSQHIDTIKTLEKIPAYTTWDPDRCPGKADILIYYTTASDRNEIRQLVGDTFYGIPYRMFIQ